MKTQDKIAELVDQVPALDKRGTFTGPSWEEATPMLEHQQQRDGGGNHCAHDAQLGRIARELQQKRCKR